MSIFKKIFFWEFIITISVILSISVVDDDFIGRDIGVYLLVISLIIYYLNNKISDIETNYLLLVKKATYVNILIFIIFSFLQYLHISFGGRLLHEVKELDVTGNPLSFLKSALLLFLTFICLNKKFIKIVKDIFKNVTFLSYPQLIFSLKYPIFFKLFENETIFGNASFRFVPYLADPNFFSIILICALIIHLYGDPKEEKDFFFNFKTGAIVLLPIFCGSKTAFAITLFIIFIRYSSIAKLLNQKISKSLFMLFLTLAFSTFIYINFGPENNEFSKILPAILEGEIFSQRLYMWASNIATNILNSWYFLFGKGFGYSRSVLGVYMHNDYLEYFVSFGLFGLALLLISKYSLIGMMKFKSFNIKISLAFLIYFIPFFFSVNSNSFYVISVFWTIIVLIPEKHKSEYKGKLQLKESV